MRKLDDIDAIPDRVKIEDGPASDRVPKFKEFEIGVDEHGYEYAKISDDDRVFWAGAPKRFATAEWDPGSNGMIRGMEKHMEPIQDRNVSDDLLWLSKWSKDDAERAVIITAPQGRGKTTYAAASLRRALGVRPAPKWASWLSLVSAVTDSWTSRDTGEADILSQYIRAGFLVVDDFGKELTGDDDFRLRDWQRRIAFELVNGRYERQLPTIITTELDMQTMAARLDAAITSRLAHEGRWIDLTGQPDHRTAHVYRENASE